MITTENQKSHWAKLNSQIENPQNKSSGVIFLLLNKHKKDDGSDEHVILLRPYTLAASHASAAATSQFVGQSAQQSRHR